MQDNGPVGSMGRNVIYQNDDSAAYEWRESSRKWEESAVIWKKEALSLRESVGVATNQLEGWQAHARGLHEDYENQVIVGNTWMGVLGDIRDEFAPEVSNDELTNRFKKRKPIEEKKYYEEYQNRWGSYS